VLCLNSSLSPMFLWGTRVFFEGGMHTFCYLPRVWWGCVALILLIGVHILKWRPCFAPIAAAGSYSYVRQDSFICVTWLTFTFICATWLTYTYDMTRSNVRYDSLMCATHHDLLIYSTWLTHVWDTTRSYVPGRIHARDMTFIFMQMRDMTHP